MPENFGPNQALAPISGQFSYKLFFFHHTVGKGTEMFRVTKVIPFYFPITFSFKFYSVRRVSFVRVFDISLVPLKEYSNSTVWTYFDVFHTILDVLF